MDVLRELLGVPFVVDSSDQCGLHMLLDGLVDLGLDAPELFFDRVLVNHFVALLLQLLKSERHLVDGLSETLFEKGQGALGDALE